MPQKFKRIFSVVATAKKRAIEALSSGCSAIEIDRVARTVIAKAGWGECFGHGLGHGLGLEIHEAPSLSPRSKEELCSGMIVTIEPGIYRPGFGGVRLEEDCLVTDEGCRVLSNAQDDIIEA